MKRNQEADGDKGIEKVDEDSDQLKRVKIAIQEITSSIEDSHEKIVEDSETTEKNIDKLINEEKELMENLKQLHEETMKMVEEQEDLQCKVEEIDRRIAQCNNREQNVKMDIKKLSSLLGYEISNLESREAVETPLNHRLIRVTYSDKKSMVVSLKEDSANEVVSSTSADLAPSDDECTSNNDHLLMSPSSSDIAVDGESNAVALENAIITNNREEIRLHEPSEAEVVNSLTNESEPISSTSDEPPKSKKGSKASSSSPMRVHGNVDEVNQLIDDQEGHSGSESCIYDVVEITPNHPNFQQIREYLHATQDVSGLLSCLHYY